MADTDKLNFDTPETAPESPTPGVQSVTSPEDTDAAQSIKLPRVAAPENALIGDDNQPAPREPDVTVDTDSVPAQVTGPAAVPVDEVYVHETSVKLDQVITDPSSPEAVQIPDAGFGSLVLPIHGLDAPTPEQFFADNRE